MTNNYNIQAIRDEFPILNTTRDNKPLVYLDNGATSQKPNRVIDRITEYSRYENSTVRRGIYHLSSHSTELYEQARLTVQQFVNARESREIVFTKGCTEAINLVAHSWGGDNLEPGDEIIITQMEHHANIVPWQLIAQKTGATVKYIPINQDGTLQLDQLDTLITEKTKLIAVIHVSNVLGTINPVKEIISKAHQHNIKVLIDACQSAPHIALDVQDLDCDFLVFSGHKLYAPTGIGVLYCKENILSNMSPYQAGGDMIDTVTLEGTTFADIPERFEAGTPPIAQAIGLAEAIHYINSIGLNNIAEHENILLQHALTVLSEIDGLNIIGNAPNRASLISFIIEGVHPYDLATLIDETDNIAIRTGRHCAEPLMNYFNVSGTARISMGMYNNLDEINIFVNSVKKALKILL